VAFLSSSTVAGRQPAYETAFLAELDAGNVQYAFIGNKARRNPCYGWKRLRSLLRSWKPDIIHSHLFYGVVFSAFARQPVVYTHHSIELRFPRFIYRLVLDQMIACYVGICGACTNILTTASARPVIRIDNGVAPARIRPFSERRADKSKVKLLAIGRLCEHKNYHLMLEAAALLADLDFEMEIAGEGPLHDELAERIRRLGLGAKVRLLGNVSDIPLRLANSDIFVMSSISEGLPIALLEATLSGLPVVVTNVGGCAEVVHHAGNGFVVDDFASSSFSLALRRLIASEELRRSFSSNALAHSGRYELASSVLSHLDLYSKLAADRKNG
jgi:glycosyltransferase involved in cell wall biosynthesis